MSLPCCLCLNPMTECIANDILWVTWAVRQKELGFLQNHIEENGPISLTNHQELFYEKEIFLFYSFESLHLDLPLHSCLSSLINPLSVTNHKASLSFPKILKSTQLSRGFCNLAYFPGEQTHFAGIWMWLLHWEMEGQGFL